MGPRQGPNPEAVSLVYVCLGPRHYLDQAIFSIYSARFHEPPDGPQARIVLFTDRPPQIPDELEVESRVLSRDEIDAWSFGGRSIFRAKYMALAETVAHSRGPCVFLDSDTYFRDGPSSLRYRIGNGRTVMHLPEGELRALEPWRMFVGRNYTDASGAGTTIVPDDVVWNSGVVGLAPSEAHLLDDVTAALESLVAQSLPGIAEQVAASQILGKRTALARADDAVYHYWGLIFARRWVPLLAMLLEQASRLPPAERSRFLYEHRPRLSLAQRVHYQVKRPLRRIGLVPPEAAASHLEYAPAVPRAVRRPTRRRGRARGRASRP